ncbi:translation initiation factor eIF-2B subunit epsilon isoform X1 [Abrus precatorius]|uniref:Translation initiation factor eIF2B subunit epsilon n=1 Tax=Abrus precatorius TaxID=3816 RepID=A0A8B8L059_ABRPR|nr:translation initiation factor eIF-2B subunit epsilon isoform X1 [Abrus precatorius]
MYDSSFSELGVRRRNRNRNRNRMGAPKKSGARVSVSEDPDELVRVPLQAILLADSFTTKFRPITLERPKVLLPLVNVPMINYTLTWLESAGVEEVFVFCCSHSKQVINYLEKSEWFSQPNFTVSTIESQNSVSAGDALRVIYERNVIHGDFILISGDTVSNMSLTQALLEHKERRKKDSNAVMTMVIKRSKPNPAIHQSRLGTDELFMAIDPNTKQLLYYEDRADHSKGILHLDKSLLADNPSLSLHHDKQDCYIDICSPEVLSLFTDNFDYQHLRRHFVKGLLLDDIMGYKIFVHEIHSDYAARVDNFRSYDTVSKDIIHRWTYPLVPDVMNFGNTATKLERQGMYRASEISKSQSAVIGPFTLIGSGTKIGNNSKISNSVIGEGCKIGSNVIIEGCYIWDNITIEDGCKLQHAIVCDGVTIKSGAILEPGAILSFKVVVGPEFLVPQYSKVSLLPQPIEEDSDEELEYADSTSAINSKVDKPNAEIASQVSETHYSPASELGVGSVGHVWSPCEGGHEEEWRHSVARIPADKILEAMQSMEDELELNHDGSLLPPSGELKPNSNDSDDDDHDDSRDDSYYFEKEVEATFLRAVHENIQESHLILEVNSLKLSYNKLTADCAGAVFYAMMKHALDRPHSSSDGLLQNVQAVFTKWKKVLTSYLTDIDEQIEVILKFEEMCLESAKDFAPLFTKILHYFYNEDIVEEDAILSWEDEKKEADETDKVFVKQAERLIQWLKEASEEEDDD